MISSNLNKKITVIIRSAGERTVNLCYEMLTSMFSNEQIFIIEEVPFAAAVKKGLEIGIEQGREWTMTIDADVLINEEGLHNLIKRAECVPDNFFEIQGVILDKFFPVFRPAGNHMYRTSLMPKAIDMIPEEGTSLRPENDLLKKMVVEGHPFMQCGAVVGIHDFEQYYKDIFRKCFVQAHKHRWIIEKAEKYWRQNQDKDQDFKVALWGSLLGKLHTESVDIDKNFVKDQLEEVASLKRVTEKPEFPKESGCVVKEILNSYNVDEFEYFQSAMFPHQHWNKVHDKDFLDKKENVANKHTLIQKCLNKLGHYLIRAGRKIQYTP